MIESFNDLNSEGQLVRWLMLSSGIKRLTYPIGEDSLLSFSEKAQSYLSALLGANILTLSTFFLGLLVCVERRAPLHTHTILESMHSFFVCSNICSGCLDALKEHCTHLESVFTHASVWPQFLRLLRCAERILGIHSVYLRVLRPIRFEYVNSLHKLFVNTEWCIHMFHGLLDSHMHTLSNTSTHAHAQTKMPTHAFSLKADTCMDELRSI